VSTSARAQQIDCNVKVSYEGVATTHKDLLIGFDSDVREYLNNYKWGNDDLEEKITCTVDIFIQNVVGENRYSAQVFIGSQRPLYNNGGNKGILRLKDDAWEFTYVRGRPIVHNEYSFNDLTSFLDFYVYLIIGYDYDTYERLSGTTYFQKAANIASLGRANGGKGWQQAKSGYNRIQLIDELLNAKFTPVRAASFKYHFAALDSLSFSRARALKNAHDALVMIGEVKKSADPRNQIIRAFFDVKYQEIAELFLGYDPKVYAMLASIDPTHQTTYEEYSNRRK
jgi:hypothetical protein